MTLVLGLLFANDDCAGCGCLLGRELVAHEPDAPELAYCLTCARRALSAHASAPACSELSPCCPLCDRSRCTCPAEHLGSIISRASFTPTVGAVATP